MSTNPGIVIIGAGHAGGRIAERLRNNGYCGTITIVGWENHLPYERPPLSKAVLTEAQTPVSPALLSAGEWATQDITMLIGLECVGIDSEKKIVRLSNNKTLPFDRLVLATGLVPRVLPVLTTIAERVHTLHSYDDALALRSKLLPDLHLLIIGAGFIGLEVAASARRKGLKVTVIEAAERPLMRVFDSVLSGWFFDLHKKNGVDLRCSTQIATITETGNTTTIILDDGHQVDADLILVGIGGNPQVSLAQSAGLTVENGVAVNSHCQTSCPEIYAIGDIANMRDDKSGITKRLESWKYAEDTASTAAQHICGQEAAYNQVPWFWTDQYNHNIQMLGTLPDHATIYMRGKLGEPGYLAFYLEDEILLGAFGLNCGGDIRRARGFMEKNKPITDRVLDKMKLTAASIHNKTSMRGIQ